MSDRPNLPNKYIIRKQITSAKVRLVAMIAQLPVEEWTDADVNINYEIMPDADIQILWHKGGGE